MYVYVMLNLGPLEQAGASWSKLEQAGASWSKLEHSRAIWDTIFLKNRASFEGACTCTGIPRASVEGVHNCTGIYYTGIY